MEVAQSCPTLCDPMDCVAHQAPLSMEFSRQEYWSGLPFPSPGHLTHAWVLWMLTGFQFCRPRKEELLSVDTVSDYRIKLHRFCSLHIKCMLFIKLTCRISVIQDSMFTSEVGSVI